MLMSMWQCPICQTPLNTTQRQWQCQQGHGFDMAKSGYVNLLPVQHKKSLQPGDDKAMLKARQAFHRSGGYAPLMQAMAEAVSDFFGNQPLGLIYDAGCGEGAYLRHLQSALSPRWPNLHIAGSDIAKLGVEMAAKADRCGQYVVASSYQLPVQANSVDALLQVFAPGSHAEFSRVLKTGGLLLSVEPGPQHLYELKQQVYQTPQPHTVSDPYSTELVLRHEQSVAFTVSLDDPDRLLGLLGMTPYIWKLSESAREQIATSLQQVSAEFVLRCWEKA